MGGGDKGLLTYRNEPFVVHLQRLLIRVGPVALVTQQGQHAYQQALASVDLSFVHDRWPDRGPLAGLAAGLAWARGRGCAGAFVAPCDSPCLGERWLQRLRSHVEDAPERVHICTVEGRLQPLHGWYPVALEPALTEALAKGERRAGVWVESQKPMVLDCTDLAAQFANVNTPADHTRLAP